MTRLKEVRISKKLTQKELSEKTGLSLRSIQHYEQGGKDFDHARLNTILTVCEALECTLEDILDSQELIDKLNRVQHN